MVASSRFSTSRFSRIVFGVILAAGLGVAIAATPSVDARSEAPDRLVKLAAFGDSATALRPFGSGPTILIGRAYGPDDEDCVLSVTRVERANGEVSVTRGISCPQ